MAGSLLSMPRLPGGTASCGKNIRTRAQALINEDLLIDLPPDTYMHKLQHNLDLTSVRYLLITHCHMDHFYPQELTVRGSGYSPVMTGA